MSAKREIDDRYVLAPVESQDDRRVSKKRKYPEPMSYLDSKVKLYQLQHFVARLNAIADLMYTSRIDKLDDLEDAAAGYPKIRQFLAIVKMYLPMIKMQFYTSDYRCVYLVCGDPVANGLMRSQIPETWYRRHSDKYVFTTFLKQTIRRETIYRPSSIILSADKYNGKNGVFYYQYRIDGDPRLPTDVCMFRVFAIDV